MQLEQSRITVMLPVEDPERAKGFYRDIVGLPSPQRTGDGKTVFTMPHGELMLVEDKDHIDHDHTALSFEVTDLNEAMKDLRDRGVRFQDFNLDGLTTVDGVATQDDVRMAWFKDTEGNVLCVHQRVAEVA